MLRTGTVRGPGAVSMPPSQVDLPQALPPRDRATRAGALHEELEGRECEAVGHTGQRRS